MTSKLITSSISFGYEIRGFHARLRLGKHTFIFSTKSNWRKLFIQARQISGLTNVNHFK